MNRKNTTGTGMLFSICNAINIGIYFLVFFAGGSNTPYPHLFYFPIMLSALTGTWMGSLVTAFFAAFLMSPWMMPLNVEFGTSQTGIGWLFRTFMFLAVSVFLKIAINSKQKEQKKVIAAAHQMEEFSQSTLNAILHLAETKDPESTGKHLEKISVYSKVLLSVIDVPDDEKKNIYRAISLHDIGKVGIPDSILLKPGKLLHQEFELMKQHTTIGGDIIKEIEHSIQIEDSKLRLFLQTVTEIVYFHHERYNGSGYPKGLKEEEIPISARIAALCDVYDALSSNRPYKKAFSHDQCKAIILKEKGEHFDPLIVDAFIKVESQFEEILNRYSAIEGEGQFVDEEKMNQSLDKAI